VQPPLHRHPGRYREALFTSRNPQIPALVIKMPVHGPCCPLPPIASLSRSAPRVSSRPGRLSSSGMGAARGSFRRHAHGWQADPQPADMTPPDLLPRLDFLQLAYCPHQARSLIVPAPAAPGRQGIPSRCLPPRKPPGCSCPHQRNSAQQQKAPAQQPMATHIAGFIWIQSPPARGISTPRSSARREGVKPGPPM